ncbi:unnamed protein product [Anisakis simplex]|uniref:Phage protein n=1 Tax=Anisakis simplex TaxID=6269 RepID=A0A0M3KHT3_ANISI|nr:unnamed protein product [Anisakis simplex]
MTEAAKKAAHQICAIINNMDITPAESDRNINKILSEMTESDRKALDAFYDESMEPLINYLENIQFPALRKL